MAKVGGAEFPIKTDPERGAGMEKWENRKENNNNERFTAKKLREGFDANRSEMFAQVRKVL